MIPHFTTPKNSNSVSRLFVVSVIVFFWSVGAPAQFKSERDRKIVKDILKVYGRECVQHEATDGDIIQNLGVEAKEASRTGNAATQKCFENQYSQVSGVFYLYQKICSDISSIRGDLRDDLAADQLLKVNKYQQGIRPYQSALNDCLMAVADKKGYPYIVPLSGTDFDVKGLQWELEQIQIKDPFAHTYPAPAR